MARYFDIVVEAWGLCEYWIAWAFWLYFFIIGSSLFGYRWAPLTPLKSICQNLCNFHKQVFQLAQISLKFSKCSQIYSLTLHIFVWPLHCWLMMMRYLKWVFSCIWKSWPSTYQIDSYWNSQLPDFHQGSFCSWLMGRCWKIYYKTTINGLN